MLLSLRWLSALSLKPFSDECLVDEDDLFGTWLKTRSKHSSIESSRDHQFRQILQSKAGAFFASWGHEKKQAKKPA